jgi:hypothetical protein
MVKQKHVLSVSLRKNFGSGFTLPLFLGYSSFLARSTLKKSSAAIPHANKLREYCRNKRTKEQKNKRTKEQKKAARSNNRANSNKNGTISNKT